MEHVNGPRNRGTEKGRLVWKAAKVRVYVYYSLFVFMPTVNLMVTGRVY